MCLCSFLPTTGMEEASCSKAVYLNSYPVNTGDFSLIMGPAARIRPKRLPDEFFSCESMQPSVVRLLIASDL